MNYPRKKPNIAYTIPDLMRFTNNMYIASHRFARWSYYVPRINAVLRFIL